jgi:hypothetical protein
VYERMDFDSGVVSRAAGRDNVSEAASVGAKIVGVGIAIKAVGIVQISRKYGNPASATLRVDSEDKVLAVSPLRVAVDRCLVGRHPIQRLAVIVGREPERFVG